MKDQNCGYCMRGELLDAFGIYICELGVSTLILFREQSHPGRCIVVSSIVLRLLQGHGDAVRLGMVRQQAGLEDHGLL